MQKRDRYPDDTVTGGCFLTGDYDPSEGVVDLDTYIDSLPPFGRLVVSPKAVRMLVTAMGWELMSEDERMALDDAGDELRRLSAENVALRTALSKVIDVATLCGLVQVAELAEFPELEPAS